MNLSAGDRNKIARRRIYNSSCLRTLSSVFRAAFIAAAWLTCRADKKASLYILPFPQEEKKLSAPGARRHIVIFPCAGTCGATRADLQWLCHRGWGCCRELWGMLKLQKLSPKGGFSLKMP